MPTPIILMKVMPEVANAADHDDEQQRGAGDDRGRCAAARSRRPRCCRRCGPTARGSGTAGTPRSPSTARTGSPASGSAGWPRCVPVGVKPSRPDRCPSWKIQTSAPNDAASDSTFITIALTGSTTEPNARNSSTSVTRPRTAPSTAASSRGWPAGRPARPSRRRPAPRRPAGAGSARMSPTRSRASRRTGVARRRSTTTTRRRPATPVDLRGP